MRVITVPTNMYTAEFKADAVALYESRPELSYSKPAADLGIARATLKTRVHKARKAAGKMPAHPDDAVRGEPETPEEELARLRIENDALRAERQTLRGMSIDSPRRKHLTKRGLGTSSSVKGGSSLLTTSVLPSPIRIKV